MIIVQVAGGLGNQLQQYALYQKFVRMGKEARLDISWFIEESMQKNVLAKRKLELDFFDRLIYEICTVEEKAELIGSEELTGKIRRKLFPFTVHRFQETQMYHPELMQFDNMYISGYFACEKYYADILYDLRERIQFPPSSNPQNQEIAEEMQKRESVSVHIRRGDYLDQENIKLFGGICTDAYYVGAMKHIRDQYPEAHFYLFSDDAEYIRGRYKGENYTVIDWNHGADSFYDMWLMSRCKHNICANSTFSFWGARLNGYEKKIMMRPAIHKTTQIFDAEKMRDLWKGWILVNGEGKIFD